MTPDSKSAGPVAVRQGPAANRATASHPRVVIVGAGFGGLSLAKALSRAAVDVTLIDRHNYHLFQPLLYQVATAGLSPADIASPIRSIVGMQRNTTVILGRVTGVDKARRDVLIGARRIPYDYLVLATGARHAYFGHDDWEQFAPGLKKIDDATGIRRRILLAFEQAEAAEDEAERRKLLNFVIVGGGPTGVELAGAVAELARRALVRDFRHIDSRNAHVVLVEAGPRLLPSFPESLSAVARRSLESLGVDVRTGTAVTACDADGVAIGAGRLDSQTVLWAAGVEASPAAKWLAAAHDRAGRVSVGPDLSVPGLQNVFVIGDTALALDATGKPLPGVAPVAKQQGLYLARLIRSRIGEAGDPGPFRYRSYGNLATIGRKAAVADFGFMQISGFVAWLLWSVAHIFFLIGFRNRVVVALSWLWSYLTFQRGARLITGSEP